MAKLSDFSPEKEGAYREFPVCENKTEYRGTNEKKHHIRQYRLDGGVYPRGTPPQKCDYLLLNADTTPKKAFFIELKSKNEIKKATEQLDSSERELKPQLPGYAIYKRIVHSGAKSLQLTDSAITKWKSKNRNVRIETTPMIESIN